MTLRTALLQGSELLSQAAVPAPRLTAEVLLAHALQRDRVYLISHAEDELSEVGWIHYGRYLHQRLKGVPTQYITKRQEFYGRDFFVGPDVLIPRPETEHVVEQVLQRVGSASTLVDAGTGSGAIAVTLALETAARVFATDISQPALSVAAANALRLGARVHFVCSDLISAFGEHTIDIVASNPPYVAFSEADGLQREVREHEPHVALFAGDDGNSMYRSLIKQSKVALRPGGWLVVELGYRSLDAVRALLGSGWTDPEVASDLAGIPRVLSSRWLP